MIRIASVDNNEIGLQIYPFSYDDVNAIKALPSRRYNPKNKIWFVPLSDIDILLEHNIISKEDYNKIIQKQSPKTEFTTSLPLYSFQKEGASFLINKKSALLADEMGVGKTVQAIAAIDFIFENNEDIKYAIIICPASLKLQWKNEIKKFLNDKYNIVIIDKKLRDKGLYNIPLKSFVILNYEITYERKGKDKIINDVPNFLQMISKHSIIVIDEAQYIRNYKTKTAKSLKKLKAPYKFALTGTPVFNKPTDIYSISQFLSRNKSLGPLNQYLIKGYWGIVGFKNLELLHDRVKYFMLRRKKEDLLDLPEKVIENIIITDITDAERRDLYYMMTGEIKEGLSLMDINEDNAKKLNRFDILGRLILLKEYTDHPDLLKRTDSNIIKNDNIKSQYHTKYTYFKQLISDYYSDNKIVVFTQFKKMLEIMVEDLSKYFHVYQLHGGQTKEERQEQIDLFNKDKEGIFISTDAGGVGLNLQTANILINYDLPYSYGKYLQRIDRIHRIGQKNRVVILNLIVKDVLSIENEVKKIIDKKKNWFEEILEDRK